ncbi:imidazole glycerol phosphate synthase subunit HisH [Alteriqipengyuania lutimaris]|uniref:Imidazole glycerol phosphate synthase subunit HisH n=1 Tax=Alteriqipengyuania lutimaris TaxID=1538146 RepID=A0A395LH72_9SPHN|nr:imidazole glycerol phosphate synthase subunit HisH [Alteriqipengyuania lutimaris]MBB3034992.1 glutamine amidotransferase [Alteriqipengyuania lutimaris]RDS76193.1 imidazole glycerol phosphate synthase subunit HisH [Alteriqipengyuania lutimaris]
MAETVALIDYGAGNLHSVDNALARVGAKVQLVADGDALAKAERIVLPGVGAFGACYEGLARLPDMIEALESRVLRDGVPFLGICVGMQLLATRGLEHGETPGLGWIGGEVRALEPSEHVKVPHMGWNDVVVADDASGLVHPGEAYFLHSYAIDVADEAHVAARTDHGGSVTAAVARDNILGVQFHPEKSQAYGLALLERFLKWRP